MDAVVAWDIVLSAVDVHRELGGQVVLGGVSVAVGPGSRVGLVGPNGVGKSTLLRILANLDQPDEGRVERSPAALTVGYLPQEAGPRPAETLRDYLGRRTGVADAEAELERRTEEISARPGSIEAHADALERFLAVGGDDLDARLGSVLDEVGLAADRLDVAVADLSGGQQARAALAAVLLSRFDVLLLDEPTNDLDFQGLDLLERFCGSLSGALVVVSHDRAFLDRTVTQVLEIEADSRRSVEFAGGWSDWQHERELARSHAYEAFEEYRSSRRGLEARARTQRDWAVHGVTKSRKNPKDRDKAQRKFFEDRTEKLAGKVKITERAIERLERDKIDKPFEPWRLRLSFAGGRRSGDMVARLDHAVVRRGSFTLGPVDLQLAWQDRVAVVGPNGGGKSTLLAALLGEVPLDAGGRHLGPGVVVGTMDQRRRTFGGPDGLLARFSAETGLEGGEARTLLAKFGLAADHVDRPGAALSPGERSRAVLAALMARGVNLLVLDEPTNHLDLPAIEQLEQALDAFDATLVLVSHDRRLLEATTLNRTIDVVGGQATERA
ncbi:MAG: ABC-F family ATP-binding cassette domain-containing protein [Acidimicrobiales bacterium]